MTGEYNKFSTAKFYILYIRIVFLPFRYYNPWTFHLTWLRCSHRNYHCCSYYVVSNDLAEDVLSTTQLFSSTHNFARSWDGNSCIICSTCIIYMIQGEEKNGATIIIDTFNARLYLWNSQSDCKPYVALLYQFFSSTVRLQFNTMEHYHNYQYAWWQFRSEQILFYQVITELGDWIWLVAVLYNRRLGVVELELPPTSNIPKKCWCYNTM